MTNYEFLKIIPKDGFIRVLEDLMGIETNGVRRTMLLDWLNKDVDNAFFLDKEDKDKFIQDNTPPGNRSPIDSNNLKELEKSKFTGITTPQGITGSLDYQELCVNLLESLITNLTNLTNSNDSTGF